MSRVRIIRNFAVAALALALPAAFAVHLIARLATAQEQPGVLPLHIDAVKVEAFDRIVPARSIFGELEWRGGLVLSSPASGFGGWSGMAISPDGRRIVAVSDRLRWMTADIAYDGNSPAGLKNASIGVLAPADPEMLGVGHDRDAEAISLLGGTPDEGEFLVSFERLSRLARIRKTGDVWSPVSAYLKTPDEVKSFGANTGFEAATVIAGGPQKGTIVAIAENYPDARGHHSGWLWVDGEPLPFALTVTPGYAISDAVSLDNGALVVLERHASWLGSFAMRLRYIAPGSIRPGAVVEGALLMQAEGSEEIDNMEAISVHRNAANETILTLMSDDNFNYLERTMLLQFALPETYARR